MIGAYHRRLTHADRAVRAQAAAAWSQWEGDTISIRGPEARPAKFNEADFAIAFARIECHYFQNRGFFEEDGWILKNVSRIGRIPGWIVQGRFDVVTPMQAAWASRRPGRPLSWTWCGTRATPPPSRASSTAWCGRRIRRRGFRETRPCRW